MLVARIEYRQLPCGRFDVTAYDSSGNIVAASKDMDQYALYLWRKTVQVKATAL